MFIETIFWASFPVVPMELDSNPTVKYFRGQHSIYQKISVMLFNHPLACEINRYKIQFQPKIVNRPDFGISFGKNELQLSYNISFLLS